MPIKEEIGLKKFSLLQVPFHFKINIYLLSDKVPVVSFGAMDGNCGFTIRF